VLYGPNRDDVRTALEKLGYTYEEIERDFIPAMLLRNSIDVGHPMLSLFSLPQLETLHKYADRAERAFRDLLVRLFREIESGRLDIPPYKLDRVDRETEQIIENLRKRLDLVDV